MDNTEIEARILEINRTLGEFVKINRETIKRLGHLESSLGILQKKHPEVFRNKEKQRDEVKIQILSMVEEKWRFNNLPVPARALALQFSRKIQGLFGRPFHEIMKEFVDNEKLGLIENLNMSKFYLPFEALQSLDVETVKRFQEFGLSDRTIKRLRKEREEAFKLAQGREKRAHEQEEARKLLQEAEEAERDFEHDSEELEEDVSYDGPQEEEEENYFSDFGSFDDLGVPSREAFKKQD